MHPFHKPSCRPRRPHALQHHKPGVESPSPDLIPSDAMPGDPSDLPPPARQFATTRWNLVADASLAGSPESQPALEALCQAYWHPIHAYILRTGAHPEAAKDLTQQFFALLLEKQWIIRADHRRGRFRSFLLTYLKRFLSDERDRASARKRGGTFEFLPLDELEDQPTQTPSSLPAHLRSPEQDFDRHWALVTLANALERLRIEAARSGREALFLAVQGHLDHGDRDESLALVARRFGIGLSALKMQVKRWRSRYQDLIRAEVADTVPHLADVNRELRHLMEALAD